MLTMVFPAEKCPAGTYKGADDNDCVECGPNTVSSVEGLSAPFCPACFHGSEPNSEKTNCRKLSKGHKCRHIRHTRISMTQNKQHQRIQIQTQ